MLHIVPRWPNDMLFLTDQMTNHRIHQTNWMKLSSKELPTSFKKWFTNGIDLTTAFDKKKRKAGS